MPHQAFGRLAMFVVLIAFFAVRLGVLLVPSSSGWRVNDDEMVTGNIGMDLGRGLVLPAAAYQFKPFAAGTMLEGVVAAPMRHLVGPNLLSLKLAALAIQAAALLFWLAALRRLAGPVAALFFALWSVMPPPAWLHLSHTAFGNHAEQALFVGALLWLMSRTWFNSDARRGAAGANFALGAVAGAGVYFSFTGLPSAAWLALVAFWLDGRAAAKRRLPGLAAGFAVGGSPILFPISYFGAAALTQIDTYLGYERGALARAARLFTEPHWRAIPGKLARLVAVDLPAASLYPGAWQRWLFWLAVLAAAALLVWFGRARWRDVAGRGGVTRSARRDAAGLVVVAYALVFAAAFLASAFRVVTAAEPDPGGYFDYRYLAPLYPAALAMLAMATQAAYDRVAEKRWRGAVAIAAAGALLIGLSAPYYSHFLRGPASRAVWEVRGDSYFLIVERMAMNAAKIKWNREQKMAALDRLRPEYRHLFFEMLGRVGDSGLQVGRGMAGEVDGDFHGDLSFGFGRYLGATLLATDPATWDASLTREMRRRNMDSPPWRAEVLRGFGAGLTTESGKSPRELLAYFGEWAATRPDDYAAVSEGLGQFFNTLLYGEMLEWGAMPSTFWRGVGRQSRRVEENMLLSKAPLAVAIEAADTAQRRWFTAGYQIAARDFVEGP